MFQNAGYLANVHEEVLSGTKPLVVGSCGTYRLEPRERLRTIRPEARQDYQLLYISRGCAHFWREDVEFVVDAGSLACYRPGEPQRYIYYGQDHLEAFWVHFSGTFAERLLMETGFTGTPTAPCIIKGGIHHSYREAFEFIINELQLRRSGFEQLCALRLRELSLIIARNTSERDRAEHIAAPIREAILNLNANLDQSLDVHELARSIGMSDSGFTGAFRRATGMPPKRYLTELRLRRATDLLVNTDHTVTDIARAVGYDNPLYFSRLYHMHTGRTPSSMRPVRKEGL